MLSQEQILTIRELLELESRSSPTILGARIGDLAKKNFPGFVMRDEYGSIRNFIETHFADVLKAGAKSGSDTKYNFINEFANIENLAVNLLSVEESISKKPTLGSNNKIDLPVPRTTGIVSPISESDAVFRKTIKSAIDMMTSEQLRQLIIPVGIIYDAVKKNSL